MPFLSDEGATRNRTQAKIIRECETTEI
jgi:hypothetical protein